MYVQIYILNSKRFRNGPGFDLQAEFEHFELECERR